MQVEKKTQYEPTQEQLREAEAGLIRLLAAKHFTREWIERQVPEAMAQAQLELAARIAAGREDETVGLLVVIAYRRTLKALSAERSKPRSIPVEEVFDLVDECARTPEQTVMDADRQARLLRAMQYLPEREKELLSLVYYCDLDLKEAGHRLGWSSSSAERHHTDALVKLRALVGERSLLGADVALPALIASDYSFPNPTVHHAVGGAADRVCQLAAWVLQHTHVIAQSGSVVAGMSGAGRTSTGFCGLAVALYMATVISVAVLRAGIFHLSDSALGAGRAKAHRPLSHRPRAEPYPGVQMPRPLPATRRPYRTPPGLPRKGARALSCAVGQGMG